MFIGFTRSGDAHGRRSVRWFQDSTQFFCIILGSPSRTSLGGRTCLGISTENQTVRLRTAERSGRFLTKNSWLLSSGCVVRACLGEPFHPSASPERCPTDF